MAVGSKINPNFPIPGVDQSSRGFRDNFAIIKEEIENIQSKNIQIVGGLISDPVNVGSGQSDIVIPVSVNLSNIQAAGSNLSVQYNNNNQITGSEIYYNSGQVGINTSLPSATLDVIGNVLIRSTTNITYLGIGPVLMINASVENTNIMINDAPSILIDNSNNRVGIGTYPSSSTLEMISTDTDPMRVISTANNSDVGIRFTTSQVNATLGLVLEQRNTNKVGGIRIDQNGNISIHANESMDASLSDSSRIINILPNNNVGIGSMTPRNQLDVQGNAYISGTLSVGSLPTVTGSLGGNSALSSLITALAGMGLIVDGTTP